MKFFGCVSIIACIFSTAAGANTSCVNNPSCDFHFPMSSIQKLEPLWLQNLSNETLWETRNEIMARHGYAFETKRARNYFSQKKYWRPVTKNVRLSAIELANVNLIKSFENKTQRTVSSTPEAQVEVVGLDPKGDGFLAVRMGPATSFKQVGRLLEGDRATVIASSGAWRHLKYWGGEGWAHSNWLRFSNSSSTDNSLSIIVVKEDQNLSTAEVTALRRDVVAMTAQISELTAVIGSDYTTINTTSAVAVDKVHAATRLKQLEERREIAKVVINRYTTPIKPEDAALAPNARQSSETFAKVPFFIPGTTTVGEVWVEPIFSDEGTLQFKWNFVDPNAEYQKIALTVEMQPEEIEKAINAFEQIIDWSKTAHANSVRRAFEKEAVCFPLERCNDTETAKISTKVIFRIEKDGSTSTIVRKMQGKLERDFVFSMESTKLMADYFRAVLDKSNTEHRSATATDEELNSLFEPNAAQ